MRAASPSVLFCAIALLPATLPAQQGPGPLGAGSHGTDSTEDQVFDAERRDVAALLQELYEKKKVVALGEPNHEYATNRDVLLALLEKVGHDPRLRYIATELPSEWSPMLERLSVDSVDEAEIPKLFGQGPCWAAPGVAHTFATVVPRIRALNAHRPARKKLLLLGIDGGHPSSRETGTAGNFESMVWNRLGRSEKAVVFYHLGHIIKRFPANRGTQNEINWMQRFLTSRPDAERRIAIVGIDYVKPPPSFLMPAGAPPEPGAEHQLARRQHARFPGQSWGVPLAPFRHVRTIRAERGAAMFVPESDMYDVMAHAVGAPAIRTTLPEAEDAIVWKAKPELAKAAADYLPVACKGP